MITYSQLPHDPRPSVFLTCPRCGGEFSPVRGDYWLEDGDRIIRHRCGLPLELVRRVSLLKRVTPEEAEWFSPVVSVGEEEGLSSPSGGRHA